jgi:hypothetical protein
LTFFEFIAIIRYKPKKEVIKVQNLALKVRDRLEIGVKKLNSEFDHEEFLQLFCEIDEIIQMGFLEEVKDFLQYLLTERKLDIVNGFLYLIYFNFGPYEESRHYLDEVKKTFPEENTFWDNLTNGSIWAIFEKSRKCDA